jgi:hypothetical protein
MTMTADVRGMSTEVPEPVGFYSGPELDRGDVALENDFLEGALSKAGLLSARR